MQPIGVFIFSITKLVTAHEGFPGLPYALIPKS